jgi:hypothetical protein
MAYGVNAPFGLRPISSISGGSWTEKTNQYFIHASADGATTYGTSLFRGDPVMWNTAAASTISGVATIARYAFNNDAATANNNTSVLGVFQSCEYTDNTGKLVQAPYWPANTAVQAGSQIKAYVIDDPDVVFEIQVSTATNVENNARFGGTNNQSDTVSYFGQNFSFGLGDGGNNLVPNNPAQGSARTGQSAIYLNNVGTGDNTVRDNAASPMKAIGYSLNAKNTIFEDDGTTVKQFLDVWVVINNHVYRAGSAGNTPA